MKPPRGPESSSSLRDRPSAPYPLLLKAFTRLAAEQIFPRQHIERWGFDPEILFLSKKLGLKLAEVPVEWSHDDRSKINPVTDGMRMFMEMLKVRWNSMRGIYEHAAFTMVKAGTREQNKRSLV